MCRGSHIVSASAHKSYNVLLKRSHTKLCEVWEEGHTCEVFAGRHDFRIMALSHVGFPNLFVALPIFRSGRLQNELLREDVCQLGPVAIAATGDFALIVIIVVAREKMAKDELRHVATVLLVDLNGKAGTVV